MKIVFYRKNAKTPFKVCHDPDKVIVKIDNTVTFTDNDKKYKIIDEDCKTVIKNGVKHILYKIWVE